MITYLKKTRTKSFITRHIDLKVRVANNIKRNRVVDEAVVKIFL